jgi:hypothetical protein
VRGVNHHAGETFIDAFFARSKVAVIEMNGDRDVAQADGGFDELLEVNRVGVLARTLGNLEDERGFSSSQASTIAWISSMLLTLKAPRAYLPLRAFANRSLVCVSGIFRIFWVRTCDAPASKGRY